MIDVFNYTNAASLEYKIAVMCAAQEGSAIEAAVRPFYHNWTVQEPFWNWTGCCYRVHKRDKAEGHNPFNLTKQRVGESEGWRLLTTDEIQNSKKEASLQYPMHSMGLNDTSFDDNISFGHLLSDEVCYRTKAPIGYFKADRFNKDNIPVPCVIMSKYNPKEPILTPVKYCEEGVTIINQITNPITDSLKFVTYKELADNYVYSKDGKSWRPCRPDISYTTMPSVSG